MCYTVIPTPQFQKDIKFYIKKKHYTNIVDDITPVIKEMEQGIFKGDPIPDVHIKNSDNHSYKVRVANSNTNVGTSNGYRIIYYVIKDDKEVYLLTIYYKKDGNRIPSKSELAYIIERYCNNV